MADRRDASDFTEVVNDELLGCLPFEDRQDFEDAARGHIADLNGAVVMALDGRVVWDPNRFSFVADDAPAPASVNPGTLDLPLQSSASPDAIKAMSLDLFFNYLGVRLNGATAGGARIALDWVFTDTGEQVALLLSNGALSHVIGRKHEAADATITLTRAALNRFILGESTLDDEAKSGEITVEPDLAPLDELLALLDEFSLWFNIIEP
jgi:alkyl sulfatase BDS1-like metallo-beta-lactamase superfamily hydrolase